jgi:hypothetical protein
VSITLTSPPLSSSFLINEIMVNPPGTDSNYEYIELRGPTGLVAWTGLHLLEIDGDGTTAA